MRFQWEAWIVRPGIALVVTSIVAINGASEPLAKWHSYHNDKLGFQLEVPDTWVTQDDPSGVAVTFVPQKAVINRGQNRG